MNTESTTRNINDQATRSTARQIAATVAKQAAAHANVDIRPVGAEDAITSPWPSPVLSRIAAAVVRSTETESYPYSSFEQGGVRRFERSPFARRPFQGGGDLPPFRVS
jgi:hypothetical protein